MSKSQALVLTNNNETIALGKTLGEGVKTITFRDATKKGEKLKYTELSLKEASARINKSLQGMLVAKSGVTMVDKDGMKVEAVNFLELGGSIGATRAFRAPSMKDPNSTDGGNMSITAYKAVLKAKFKIFFKDTLGYMTEESQATLLEDFNSTEE